MFRPHLYVLRGICGLWINTKMEADKKLTVIISPQILDWRSIAQSSGDFCRRLPLGLACGHDQEN